MDEQPNPNIPSDGIMPEAIEDHISNTTDNRSQANFSITQANAVLLLDQDSFKGETGNFSGLDPIRISFSLRNIGPVSIQPSDVFTAQVTLSKDDVFSGDDFILREFDLGGNALGRNLMPNETILLNWVQQLLIIWKEIFI